MQDIKPTRSELIVLKERIKLAERGHNLLKRKKDGLIQEFFRIWEDVHEFRCAMAGSYKGADKKLNLALAMDGRVALESIALASKPLPNIWLEPGNIMGVVVPKIKGDFGVDTSGGLGYGVIGSDTYIDDVVSTYREFLDNVLKSAEKEATLKKVLLEVEKTKRRVSALEDIVIPNMKSAANFIRLRLEELERENLFRLKRVKKKKEKGEK
ncbi:MAG: V-type ATP synthase subunit D [archaeon]